VRDRGTAPARRPARRGTRTARVLHRGSTRKSNGFTARTIDGELDGEVERGDPLAGAEGQAREVVAVRIALPVELVLAGDPRGGRSRSRRGRDRRAAAGSRGARGPPGSGTRTGCGGGPAGASLKACPLDASRRKRAGPLLIASSNAERPSPCALGPRPHEPRYATRNPRRLNAKPNAPPRRSRTAPVPRARSDRFGWGPHVLWGRVFAKDPQQLSAHGRRWIKTADHKRRRTEEHDRRQARIAVRMLEPRRRARRRPRVGGATPTAWHTAATI
jgi:hypothetical protein